MRGGLRRDARGRNIQVREPPGEVHLRVRFFVPGVKAGNSGPREQGTKKTRDTKARPMRAGLLCLRPDARSSEGDYWGVVSGGMELGFEGFELAPLAGGPKVEEPTGVVVLPAGWPIWPGLPPPT